MGFNTACIILNDQLHTLANREGVGRDIELSVLTAERRDRPHRGEVHYTPGFEALPSQHADTVQIVAVGGNMIRLLGHGHWRHEPEELLRALADQMGFRLTRKAARP